MAKQPETLFKERVYKLLKKIPGIYFDKIQQKTKRGSPDFYICLKGLFIAWELKVGKNKADPLQMYTMEKIAVCGGLVWVVRPDNLEWSLTELQRIAGMVPKNISQLEFDR